VVSLRPVKYRKLNLQLQTHLWKVILRYQPIVVELYMSLQDVKTHKAKTRVLLEKLNDSQLVKKFPAIFGTRRFITAFTTVPHVPDTTQSNPVYVFRPIS
jgi:hypothetical protein